LNATGLIAAASLTAWSARTSAFSVLPFGGLSGTPVMRDDVDMQVRHRLRPCTLVALLDRDAVNSKHLHRRAGDMLRDPHDLHEMFGLAVEDGPQGRLGQHHRMAGCARPDIEKRQRILVLVDLMARYLAAQDPGENVVGVVMRY
jgi:hypothetical protein